MGSDIDFDLDKLIECTEQDYEDLVECDEDSVESDKDVTELEVNHENGGNFFDIIVEGSEAFYESEKPYPGMKFKHEDDAYAYYNHYSLKTGFGIRKGKVIRSKKTKEIISRRYYCAKEGFKENDKRRTNVVVRRRDIREGCKAMMGIKLSKDNLWVVNYFSEEHNHDLATPSKTGKIRSHRRQSHANRNLVIDFASTNMRPSQIQAALTALDDSGSAPLSQQETRDIIKKHRQNNVGKECRNIIKDFQERHEKDVDFFFEVEIDEECRMRNVFWVDSRSRAQYQQFGDVVVFDTTYRTNKFEMPFAPFTGVNHHLQSILFGCALLADEKEESFIWLFSTWLRAMMGKEPVSIITDQCAAMAKAIKMVFPNTRHRLCMWHIGQNELKHLTQIKIHHKTFEWDYRLCKNSDTIEEFERSWDELISRYKLQNNSWLKNMYDIRCYWIPCYLNDTFFAGMSTTQRAESMNSYFDGYINAKTSLNDFVRQYDLALKHRRDAENDEDHHTLYTFPEYQTASPLEKQAAKIYTRNAFMRFQAEMVPILSYFSNKTTQDGDIISFVVGSDSEKKRYVVNYDQRDANASCTCKNFEFRGFLCSHILRVYSVENVMKVPSRYILPRWTINARFGHIGSVEGESSTSDIVPPILAFNYRSMSNRSIELATRSMKKFKIGYPLLRSLVDKLQEDSDEEIERTETCNIRQTSEEISTKVKDPWQSKARGRPRNQTRLKGGPEQNMAKKAKQRKCSICQRYGHKRTTCPFKDKAIGDPTILTQMSFTGENLSEAIEGSEDSA